MIEIKLKQVIEDPKHLIKTEAYENQGEILLDEEFIAKDENGITQLVYMKLPDHGDKHNNIHICYHRGYRASCRIHYGTTKA